MKNRIVAGLAAALVALSWSPSAQAESSRARAEEPVVEETTQTIGFYSAMTDFLSCTYYPMRPWCPNASRYA